MRVFVSSPLHGLRDARAATARAISEMAFEAFDFGTHGAEDAVPVDRCLAEVRQCDVFVSLLGDTYGTIAPSDPAVPFADGETSISEIELRNAELLGRPTLIYVKADIDPEPRQGELIESLEGLYSRTTMGRIETPDQLASQVKDDLARLITQLVRRTYRHPKGASPKVHVFPTATHVFAAAAEEMYSVLSRKVWPVITLGAGRTTAGVYEALVSLADERGDAHISRARFVGQTEYLGFLAEHPHTCESHLRASLVDKIRKNNPEATERDIFLPSAVRSGTFEGACNDIDARLDREAIHLSIFGFSPTGEVLCIDAATARGEDPLNLGTRIVSLSAESRQYVSPRPLLPHVATIGFRNVLRSERLIAVLVGNAKADILRRLVDGPVDPECPVTLLRSSGHRELYVYVDELAARQLSARDPGIIRHES